MTLFVLVLGFAEETARACNMRIYGFRSPCEAGHNENAFW